MDAIKNEVITAFKNSCILLDPRLVIKRSISVQFQFQRNVFEIETTIGLVRIRDKHTVCCIELFPFINNKFNLKDMVSFEISKSDYDELKNIYFGKFKEDKEYLMKINNLCT